MRILVLNPILATPEKNVIPEITSIKDTMIHTMCEALHTLGHDVTLAAAADYAPTQKEDYNFEVKFFPSQGPKALAALIPFSWPMWRYVKSNAHRFDMILCSETFGFHTLFAALAAPRKTLIWQELAVLQKKFHRIPAKIWYNIVAPLTMRKCTVVARSEAARKFVGQYLPQVKPYVVEHGMDLDRFVAGLPKKNQFIVVSQLIERKNIGSIIRKFASFVKKYAPEYRLLICGRGPEREKLEELVEELGIKDNVRFMGFRTHDEIGVMMAESRAMLVDTFQDANMITIPEAIVAGTPVITNCVPTTDLIEGHGTGIRRDGWNEEDLLKVARDVSYSEACMKMREKLGSVHQATTLVDSMNTK